MVQGPGSMVHGPGSRVQGPGFRIRGALVEETVVKDGREAREAVHRCRAHLISELGFRVSISELGFRVSISG